MIAAMKNNLSTEPMSGYLLVVALLCVSLCGSIAHAQGRRGADRGVQKFELRADHLGLVSTASLQGDILRIVGPDRQATDYVREGRYDSADGRWQGFYSRELRQVLRWPTTNSGNMQIGDSQRGTLVYRTSQMTLSPLNSAASRPFSGQSQQSRIARRPVLPAEPISPSPQIGGGVVTELAVSKLFDLVSKSLTSDRVATKSEMVRLGGVDASGRRRFVSHDSRLTLSASSARRGSDWLVTPVGGGFVRLQVQQSGRLLSLMGSKLGRLALSPPNQDARQFWKVSSAPRRRQAAQVFALESVAFPGQCVAFNSVGSLIMQPTTFAANQVWLPYVAPGLQQVQPFWRSVRSDIISAAQLPPAQIDLVNSHRYALVLALADSRQEGRFQQLRVEPGQSLTVELERDTGATLIEVVEVRSAAGVWDRQEFRTEIPPRGFYDLSVYEEHLQSIAIDATGKSPNPIEDVNYVPKSVGWFALPAGKDLPDRGSIDVYPRAMEAMNPGAVRRLDPKQFDKPAARNQLEAILDKVDSLPRRKF